MFGELSGIYSFLVAALIAGSLLGCEHSPDTLKDYQAWMQDPDHGLVEQATVSGLTLEMQYLPPRYLAQRRKTSSDSLLHFRLTLDPTDSDGNIMMRGIHSLAAYRKRVRTFSLHMKERIHLETERGERSPLHVAMGHVYNLKQERQFSIVFADPNGTLRASDQLTLVLTDDVLGTGITRFTFDGQDLREVPAVPTGR